MRDLRSRRSMTMMPAIDFQFPNTIELRYVPRVLAKILPGKRVHRSTVFRWVLSGVIRDGVRVRLQVFKVGRRTFTTGDALWEFLKVPSGTEAPPQPSTHISTHQQKKNSVARQKLKAMGV